MIFIGGGISIVVAGGTQDLANIRIAAAFLSKTELKFDLVSAVDELAAQIKLEFDFEREAKVMDSIAEHLKVQILSHNWRCRGCLRAPASLHCT